METRDIHSSLQLKHSTKVQGSTSHFQPEEKTHPNFGWVSHQQQLRGENGHGIF